MKWHDHSKLEGTHALFSPSRNGWENYDYERMREVYCNSFAPKIGTVLHKEAERRISKKLRLHSGEKNSIKLALYDDPGIPDGVIDILDFEPIFRNLMAYVNDAISFRMDPEVILYNNEFCYGTVDAISFIDNYLRIHDLKTGVTPAHIEQLLKYAALFCLEYEIKPKDIQTELRVYQLNDVNIYIPDPRELEDYCRIIQDTNKLSNSVYGRRTFDE